MSWITLELFKFLQIPVAQKSDLKPINFGLMESLAYFLSDTSDSCTENLSSTKTLLCGSMFGYRKFTELAAKNIKAGAQICLNRELPIDN